MNADAPSSISRGGRVAICLLVLLVLALTVFLLAPPSSQKNVHWLSKDDLKRATHTGVLTQWKYRVARLLGPLWPSRHRATISVNLDVVGLAPTVTNQFNLNPPTSTNADGLRAWVLSPDELIAFREKLKTTRGVNIVNSPRIITADRMQSQISSFSTLPPRKPGDAMLRSGTTVNVLGKIISPSIQLMVGASLTDFTKSSSNEMPAIKTNLDATCTVLIPSTGGLILAGGNADNHDATNYWLVIVPTILDKQGKPVKP